MEARWRLLPSVKKLRHFLGVIAGIVLLIIGVPLFLTPLPGGALCVVLGLALLITSNQRVQRFVCSKRAEHPRMNGRLNHLEEKVPRRARAPLEKTRPD